MPFVGGDALRSEGFVWAHQPASSEEPETASSGSGEAWNVWGAGRYVMFSYNFGPREEDRSSTPFYVDNSLLCCAVDADVVESFEFTSGVSCSKVFLSFSS